MTRIGLAYNQKPEPVAPPETPPLEADATRPEEEPPSRRRDVESRTSRSPASSPGALAVSDRPVSASPADDPRVSLSAPSDDDEYAEWDSAETIAAVAGALSAFGEVVPLEATERFPERLREERPDIVFNMAEGLRGVNRESHVPAICEFFGVPYSGSDPLTLSLCLDKRRAKEVLSYHGVRTAEFVLVENRSELAQLVAELRRVSGKAGVGSGE